jgi:hypothetical protein
MGKRRGACRVSVWKPTRRLEDIIKMDVQGIGWGKLD